MTHDYMIFSVYQSDSTTITDIKMGEMICGNCGLVISDKIQETRSECQYFNTEEANNRNRMGIPSPSAHHDRGLSTVIGMTIETPMNTS